MVVAWSGSGDDKFYDIHMLPHVRSPILGNNGNMRRETCGFCQALVFCLWSRSSQSVLNLKDTFKMCKSYNQQMHPLSIEDQLRLKVKVLHLPGQQSARKIAQSLTSKKSILCLDPKKFP